MLFAELTYTLATEEAERIGVDHVARMTATGSGENSTGNEAGGVSLEVGVGGVVTSLLNHGLSSSPCSSRTPDSTAQCYQDVAQPRQAHLGVRQGL